MESPGFEVAELFRAAGGFWGGRIDQTLDGQHVFCFEPVADGRLRIVFDGVRGQPFDELMPQQSEQILVRSPDGRRVAYYGRRSPGFFVGVDGVEEPTFEAVSRSVPPTFSADGSRLVYGVLLAGSARLVVDGSVAGRDVLAPVPAVFSPDGRRLAYAATTRAGAGEPQWIVINGEPGPRLDGISNAPGALIFSPDSRRFAYAGVKQGRVAMVLEGDPGEAFPDLAGPAFSADSRRFAVAARLDDGRMVLVLDGRRADQHDFVSPPIFDPFGDRLAYVCADRGRWRVVLNGGAGPPFVDLWEGIAFAPGGRTAYLGKLVGTGLLGRFRSRYVAVVDETPRSEWEQVSSSPHFDGTGARVAFAGRRAGHWHCVVNDEPGPPFKRVGPPRFSSSGRLAYAVDVQGGYAITVDHVPGPVVEELWALDSHIPFVFSPDGEHIAYAARMSGDWRPVIDSRVGPPFEGVGQPAFEDGTVAWFASRAGQVVRVVASLG